MSISDLSIRRPVFAWMLMAFLVVFGAIAWSRMGVSQMPDVDFPTVSITVSLEGASPEIMESDVLDVIEDAVMSVEGVREVTSSARQGRASVTIEFDISRDIDAAVQDIQTKIAQAQRLLPRDIDPPIVSKNNPEDQPILWLSLSGPWPLAKLAEFAKDHVKDRFQTVEGVGEVRMGGYLERNMRVWLKLDELESRQLTVDDVVAAIQREHIEVPAGRIEGAEREMNVRAFGEAASKKEFEDLVVTWRGNSPVLLGQIATIEDGTEDRRRMARALGVPSVGLGIRKQYGANAVAVAHAVKERMEEIRADLPEGLDLGVNFDGTRSVEEAVHEIQQTIVVAVILTSLVCWLFLGSFSSTLNVLLAIPTSIVGSFIILYFLNFTLNTFTLLALSLAVGIVVDDAIMVLENIVRHRERGEPRAAAASRGTREILFAALAATLALVAIFLPIAFMEGIIGKFLYQFGLTISVAVMMSLLEAITLTPMRCSRLVDAGARTTILGRLLDRGLKGLTAGYSRLLAPALRWRWMVLLVATGGFAGSLAWARSLRQELVPAQDQSVLMVRMQTPVGSTIDYTDERVKDVERFMASRPEVARYFAIVGGFGGGEVDTAMMFVTMHPPGHRGEKPVTQQEFEGFLRGRLNAIPGLRAMVTNMNLRGLTGRGSQYPVEFVLTGPDLEELAERSERMMDRMRESGLMTDVNSNYRVGMPEVRIVPDRRQAGDRGVSMAAIGGTINALIGGVRAGKFKEGGHRYDVRVRLQSDQRSSPDDVKRLFVRNRDGQLVRLKDVIDVSVAPSIQSINRRNRVRAITITAGLEKGKSQADALAFIRTEAASLPPGYGVEFTGTAKVFEEAAWAFLFAILLGVVIAYMILASQFNSFVHPLLVLLAMPFSVTGALAAMHLADISFNLYSMIGFVLLMGIVKKNSILLVDFANQVRRDGVPAREALLRACPIRLRPILMTSVSTIAAVTPAAFAWGAGAETMKSMAVVVIGGVLFSTLLTLFVVPAAYAIFPGRVAPEIDLDGEPAPRAAE